MYGSQNMGVNSSLQSNIINKNNNNNNSNSNNVKKAGHYGIGDNNMTTKAPTTTTTVPIGMNSGGNRIHANSQHLQQQLPHATNSTTTISTSNNNVRSGGNGFMGAVQQQQQQQQRTAINLCTGGASKGSSSELNVKPVNSLVVGQTHSVEGGSRAQTVENQSQALTFLKNQNNCRKNNHQLQQQQPQVLKTPEFLKLNEQFDSIRLNQSQQQPQNGYLNRQQNFQNSNHCSSVENQLQQQQQQQLSHYSKPFQINAITTSDFNIQNNNNSLESAHNNNNSNSIVGGGVIKTTLNLPVTSYAATQQQQQPQLYNTRQYPVEQIYYSNNNNTTTADDNYVYVFNPQVCVCVFFFLQQIFS